MFLSSSWWVLSQTSQSLLKLASYLIWVRSWYLLSLLSSGLGFQPASNFLSKIRLVEPQAWCLLTASRNLGLDLWAWAWNWTELSCKAQFRSGLILPFKFFFFCSTRKESRKSLVLGGQQFFLTSFERLRNASPTQKFQLMENVSLSIWLAGLGFIIKKLFQMIIRDCLAVVSATD